MLDKKPARIINLTLLVSILIAQACSSADTPERPPVEFDTDAFTRDLRAARDHLDPERNWPVTAELPIPAHPSVAAAIEYFSTDRRTTIQGSLDRSARYREMVERVIEENGLPPELAFLPVIESGFRTDLTSRAGAHGMWQFMAPTAREYELRVDWWVDERADPLMATHAAATYLRVLYRMFDDWPLALAAYNAGPGRVSRTLKRTGATTFWELLDQRALPKETRGYVPTFFATAAIIADPDRYGFRLPPPTPDATEIDELIIRGPVSLGFLAERSGSDQDLLASSNLAYHRGILPPGRSILRVPREAVSLIARHADEWHRLDPALPVSTIRVRGADSITTLAARLAVDPDEVRSMNGLSSNRIAAGSTLWVPLSREELGRRMNGAVSRFRDPASGTHTVERGETLYSIARRHGTTVEELLEKNGIGPDAIITPGDQIRLD